RSIVERADNATGQDEQVRHPLWLQEIRVIMQLHICAPATDQGVGADDAVFLVQDHAPAVDLVLFERGLVFRVNQRTPLTPEWEERSGHDVLGAHLADATPRTGFEDTVTKADRWTARLPPWESVRAPLRFFLRRRDVSTLATTDTDLKITVVVRAWRFLRDSAGSRDSQDVPAV